MVLRWRRNRTGRPLFSPQIHQKNIWTLSKFHKTTSECQQRTSGTQKSSPLSLKGDRKNIKDKKKETKEVGTELRPSKGVLKREKFPNTRKHSHCWVCAEPWKHRGQHNREEKLNNQNPQITSPTVTPPVEKQRRGLHPPLASRSWAGRHGLHCLE